jgi:hypothetical protein
MWVSEQTIQVSSFQHKNIKLDLILIIKYNNKISNTKTLQ